MASAAAVQSSSVGHDVGHLRLGVLRRPYVVGGDHRFGDIGIEDMHAEGQQKGRAVLQRGLHQVTDQGPHLPQRESFRKTLDRIEARFQHVGAGFLPQGQTAGMGILDGVEVHDLVAQLAAVVVMQVRRVGLRDAVGIGEQRAPVDQIGRIADAVGQRGRAQGGRHRVAQGHQFLAFVEIFGVAWESDAEHQAEVPDREVKAGGQGLLCALQQMPGPLARQLAKQVAVASGAAPLLGLLGLILVLEPQVGVVAQLASHLGRGEQMKLDTGAGRAIGIERDQHFRHPLVRARLGHEFHHEAHAVAVDEDLLGSEIGGVR